MAAGLVLVLLAGYWSWQQSRQPTLRAMTEGTVTSRAADGDNLALEVRFRAGASTHTVAGRVDKDAFEWQGSKVWVCYVTDDPDEATIRLPYDPLCNVK